MTQYVDKANEFIQDVETINQFVNGDTGTVVTLPNGQTVSSMRKLANDTVSYLNDPGNHYTKAEIDSGVPVLNGIKNVDGSGSGLDADLVRGLPADFTHSIVLNGYQKLPSGLIIQWGSYFKTTTSPLAITFPIVFPNAVFSIVFGSDWMNNTNEYTPFATDITNTGFIANSQNGTSGYSEKWIAIGH